MVNRLRWGRIAARAASAYLISLAGLFALRLVLGDRGWVLFAAGSLLLYAFLPAPLVLMIGVWQRRKVLLVGFAALALTWCSLWGRLFWPRAAAVEGPKLRVLTYNALGFNLDVTDTVRVVRESGADVVALQELNPEASAALERELGDVYPHRWLDPQPGVVGAGLLSKHPLVRSSKQLEGTWLGRPLSIDVSIAGRQVTVVCFHAYSGPGHWKQREAQARALADYARRRGGPLVALGDLNATDRNRAHALITEELRDAWLEVGWGFGHTFPGEPTWRQGGSRPSLLGVGVPLWLIRIDYVFHSPELVAERAEVTSASGRSDHRGVVATLALR